ncbi:MAG: hypothetical protein KA714_30480 [Limnoraphis sp. WC205]|jgi:hypothetical protein|nr:hypothetical protein [Limnoraphis sp. WC205]
MYATTTVYEIKHYQVNGQERFSKLQTRKLLGIRHRDTLIKNVAYLKKAEVNLSGTVFTWDDIYELLALHLYLNINRGDTVTFTRKMYTIIRQSGMENVKTVLSSFDIDLDQIFEEIQNDFNRQQIFRKAK